MARLQKGQRKAQRAARATPKTEPAPSISFGPAPRDHLIAAGLCALLLIATYITYSNSFRGQFVFDDSKWILAMSEDRDKNRDVFEVMSKSRRPIVEATLYWDFKRADKIKATRAMVVDEFAEPAPYHWTNLIIHMIAGLALFGVIRRTLLLGPFPKAAQEQAHWIAFAGALLWLLHPLNTQAVTYLIQRAESLMGMFYLLTLYSFTYVISSRSFAGRAIAAAFAVFFCWLGMGSKAVMVTAPFVVLLYDLIFGCQRATDAEAASPFGNAPAFITEIKRRIVQIAKKRGVVHILLFCTLAMLFQVGVAQGVLVPKKNQSGTVGFSLTRDRPDKITPKEYLVTQFGVIAHYLKLAVAPIDQALDYRWPILSLTGEENWLKKPATFANAALPGLFIAALGVTVVIALIRKPWLGFLGAWFFIILAPTSSFVPIRDPLYEHRMYLSLAALIVGVVALLWWLVGRVSDKLPSYIQRGAVVAVLCLPLAIVLGMLSFQRNALYANPVQLWADNVATRPLNDRGLNNYGKCLLDTIEDDLQKKLGLEVLTPEEKLTNLNLAVDALRKATEIRPTFVNAWFNLGNGLSKRAKLIEAIERSKLPAPVEGKRRPTLSKDVMQTVLQGFKDAAAAYEKSIQFREGKASAWVMLGNAYTDAGEAQRAQGNIPETIALFEKAAETFLAGEQGVYQNTSAVLRSRLRFNLGNSYFRLAGFGRSTFEEAIVWYEKALEVNPRHPLAWLQIANCQFGTGQYEEALGSYRRGLANGPPTESVPLARVRIAMCLRSLGKLTEAVNELEAFLQEQPGNPLAQQQLRVTKTMIDNRPDAQGRP